MSYVLFVEKGFTISFLKDPHLTEGDEGSQPVTETLFAEEHSRGLVSKRRNMLGKEDNLMLL